MLVKFFMPPDVVFLVNKRLSFTFTSPYAISY